MVIFGATGDLTKRKLFPALYQLAAEHLLAPSFAVLGVGREASLTDETFREQMRDALGESDEVKQRRRGGLAARSRSGSSSSAATRRTPPRTRRSRRSWPRSSPSADAEERNRFFYLAVPPSVFEPIVRHLSASGLVPRIDDPNRAAVGARRRREAVRPQPRDGVAR